jgi:small multidrug resistance pump
VRLRIKCSAPNPSRSSNSTSNPMHWLYLFAAIAFEISGTTCMKLSEGFTRLWPSIGIFIFYGSSIISLTMAVKTIEISIAYAIWSAVGVALIAIIGAVFFQEQLTPMRIFFLAIIIIGVVGLNLSSRQTGV